MLDIKPNSAFLSARNSAQQVVNSAQYCPASYCPLSTPYAHANSSFVTFLAMS